MRETTLDLVPQGRRVKIKAIKGGFGLRRRLAEMGLKEGTEVQVAHSLRPGPCLVACGNARLVLGHGMAAKIVVTEK